MIYSGIADITTMNVEVIVNAANGVGIMGAGVAGAIRRAAGPDVQSEAKEIFRKNGKPISEGECYITGSGNLGQHGIKKIYHAVTMEFPGGRTSMHTVQSAIKNVFLNAMLDNVESIAIPALGTGIGGLSKTSVAYAIVKEARNYTYMMDIYIVDICHNFIDEVNKLLKTKKEYKNDTVK